MTQSASTLMGIASASKWEDGVAFYMSEIRKFPVLSQKEEVALARNVSEKGDLASKNRLINSHLRLVVKVAKMYRHYGLPLSDLIAEGNLGLMRAIEKFEPERGFRLSTYAMWWIRASINEYVLNAWSLVKIGSSATRKRLFYNLRKLKAKLGFYMMMGRCQRHMLSEIAKSLDVTKDEVLGMDARLTGRDSSLNVAVGEEQATERLDFLIDTRPNQEECLENLQERRRSRFLVRTALSSLDTREQDIVVRRRLVDQPVTLESLGEDYGVSRERIRQIRSHALKKLEKKICELLESEGRLITQALRKWTESLHIKGMVPEPCWT